MSWERGMLLTITTTHRPATDLGYLLHKHPDRFQSYDLSFGKAHVFYPEAADDRCTACLLLDVDPVGIVRGKGSAEGLLSPVRQRPALRRLVVPQRGDLAGLRLGPPGPLQGPARPGGDADPARRPGSTSLPVRGGERFLRAVFEPLGYAVECERHPLDERFPEWGESPYFSVTDREGDHALGPADAPLRPGAGLRQPEALLRRRRRDGEAAGQGERLAGRPPREGGDHPPLPEVPAEPLPAGPRPARRRGAAGRSRGGRSARRARPRTCWRGR